MKSTILPHAQLERLWWKTQEITRRWRKELSTLSVKWKLVQPLWRTAWEFLKKLRLDLPYDPASPLLDICLKNMNTWIWNSVRKDSDAGTDWGQEEKGATEDEMARWHHWLDGHESVWTLGVGNGQGRLACCNSWGRKESDTTEWLNWTELNWSTCYFHHSTVYNGWDTEII